MLLPCEVAVKCLLPSVRAMLAKELMAKHDVRQAEAAKLLGVSQPAISLYCREMRGKTINLENDQDIQRLIEQLAKLLAKGNLSHKEFIPKFCEICKTTRAKGLLCQMHKTFDPSIDIESCELCSVTNSMRCL
jgi:predicted transcriptional regulator